MFLDFFLAAPVDGLLLPSNLVITSGTSTPAESNRENHSVKMEKVEEID